MSVPSSAPRLLAPDIVGREVVLERLEALLASARRRGVTTQLVADPGFGKTRIAAEVAARARAQGRLVLEGRAHPLDAALPLGVVADALRGDRRARPDAPPPQDPLAAGFPARVLPELGAEAPDQDERGSLFEAASRYVRALAGPSGLVLVLEDLHWADPSSHALVHYLTRTTVADPVLVLVTYRPDEAAPGSSLDGLRRELARERLAEELVLGPLDRPAVAAMLAGILGTAPDPPAEETIFRMSAGNPFVVEELVRDAVECGRLDPASGRWRESGPLDLPWTVQEMLLTRVRRLSEPDQDLLCWAAVVGRRFDLRVLARAADRDEDAALTGLARLREAGLVAEDSGDATGLVFSFRHALTREAVASELLTAERRRRHARVLEAAEAVYADSPDAPLDELVGHALAAGDADRGFHYSMRAARRSNELGGYVEAREHLERALELWHPGLGAEVRANLLLSLGRLLMRLTRDRRAVTLLMDAREAYLALDDAAWAAVALAAAGEARWDLAEHATALEELRAAREELGPDAPVECRLKVLAALSRVLMLGGEPRLAAEVAGEALALVPEGPNRTVMLDRVQLLNNFGSATWMLGAVAAGRAALLESLRLAREHRDDAGAVRAYINLSVNLPTSPVEGARHLEEALVLARERGLRPQEIWLLTVQAELHLEAGELGPASDRLDDAERAMREVGPEATSALIVRLDRASLALMEGDAERALDGFATVLPEAEASGDPNRVSWARWGLASALLVTGDFEAAEDALAPIPAIREPERARQYEAPLVLAALEAAASLGRAARAERLARSVERILPGPRADYAGALARLAAGRAPGLGGIESSARSVESEGRRSEALRMRVRGAALLAERPDGADEAAQLAGDALSAYRGMGAESWARRMEELLRRLGRRAPSRGAGAGREGLTARELEVLRLLADGVSNRAIADRLVISDKTAARHVANIFAKLAVHTRAQAAKVAAERGLLEAGAPT